METVNPKPIDPFAVKETQQLLCENGENEPRTTKKYSYTFSTQPLKTDLKKLLRQVTGETDLLNVTEVKLKVVTGQAGLHRLSDYTPNLTTLILDGSCISSFRDLGSNLKSLMTLSVARCNMKHFDGVWGFRNLCELNARDNFISDPSPCSGVQKLSKLDLRDNQVTDVSYFAFLRSCRQLEELYIAGNKFSEYRKEIRKFIPQLRILDGEELEDCLPRPDGAAEGYIPNNGNQSSEDGSTASLFIEEIDFDRQMETKGGEEKEGEKEKEAKDGGNREERQKGCNEKCESLCSREERTGSASIDVSEMPFDVRIQPNPATEDSETGLSNADKVIAQEAPPATGRLSYGRVICGNLAVSLLTRNSTKSSASLALTQEVNYDPESEGNGEENRKEHQESEVNLKR